METNLRTTSTIAWTALALSALAIIFSFMSWNNGDDGEVMDNDGYATSTTQGVVSDIKLELARLRAASQLALLETKQTGTEGYSEFEQKVNEIKANLAASYKEAKRDTSSEWRAIEADFGNLTTDIKNKSVSAITKLRVLIDRLVNNE